MPQPGLHPDFKDLLAAFAAEHVEYLLIGGYAVSFHARPRLTKDIDLLIADTPLNLARVHSALAAFGAPEAVLAALTASTEDDIVWFGVAPARVDILRRAEGVEFSAAYGRRLEVSWEGVPVSVIAREDLIAAKLAAGREQDLRDVRALERSEP